MPLSYMLDNLILRAVSRTRQVQAARKLARVAFAAGRRFWEENEPVPYAVFPLQGVISLQIAAAPRKRVEVAQVGREGFAGLDLFLGSTPMSTTAAVAVAGGEALTMPPEVFRNYLGDAGFRNAIEIYASHFVLMMGRMSVCNRVHGIDELCVARLLLMHDRTQNGSFQVTQESLARQLGVRRASVSRAASRLRKEGAIDYDRRGRLTIVSRGQLEKFACSCYRSIKAGFDTMVETRGGW